MTAQKISVSFVRRESGNGAKGEAVVMKGEGPSSVMLSMKHEAAPGGPQALTVSHSAIDPAAPREIRIATGVAIAGEAVPPPPPPPLSADGAPVNVFIRQ
jgi:hypothetical protein